jgi:Arc/MetJ-type ribon-helix-helix transcriptional regulator
LAQSHFLPPKWFAMENAFSPEVRNLIDLNLSTGLYSSDDDVLQAALHVLSDYHATIADVRQGIVDYENGLGEPLSEAMADIRVRLGSQL